MNALINPEHEFYEVLNEFPILKQKLKDLKVNVSDLREGLSIDEYFTNKSYSQDEIAILIRKFNQEVKQLLKSDKIQTHQLDDSQIQIKIEEEEE